MRENRRICRILIQKSEHKCSVNLMYCCRGDVGARLKCGVPWTYCRDALGAGSRRTTSVGLGWAFHSASGLSLLDHNACPRGQGMMYAEQPPWTFAF